MFGGIDIESAAFFIISIAAIAFFIKGVLS